MSDQGSGYIDPTVLLEALMADSDGNSQSSRLTAAAKILNLFQDLDSVNPNASKQYVPEVYPDFQETPSVAAQRYKDKFSQAALADIDSGQKSAADIESLYFDYSPEGDLVLKEGLPEGVTYGVAKRAVQAARDREDEIAKGVTDRSSYERDRAKFDAGEQAKYQASQENDPYGYVQEPVAKTPSADEFLQALLQDRDASGARKPVAVKVPDGPAIPDVNTYDQLIGDHHQQTVDTRIRPRGSVQDVLDSVHGTTPQATHVQQRTKIVNFNPDGYRDDAGLQRDADVLSRNQAVLAQMRSKQSRRPSNANVARQDKAARLMALLGLG